MTDKLIRAVKAVGHPNGGQCPWCHHVGEALQQMNATFPGRFTHFEECALHGIEVALLAEAQPEEPGKPLTEAAIVKIIHTHSALRGEKAHWIAEDILALAARPAEEGLRGAKHRLKTAIGAECARWAARQAMGVSQPTLVESLYPIIDGFDAALTRGKGAGE